MKKSSIIFIFFFLAVSVSAQVPEDALKYSWQPVNGSARIMAVGGAVGSLGGDISALFVNPAGLAFYKTSDVVISPGYSYIKNNSNYRGTDAKDNDSYFNLGPTGIVGGWSGPGKWTNSSLSFAVNQTANFRNSIYYKGQNDFSSQAEQYAAEAANSGMSIDAMLNSTAVSLATRMALQAYVIDTVTLGNNVNPDFVSMAMWDKLKNNGSFLVNQEQTIETYGGITEIALGYAANMDDKFYMGLGLGIPIVQYKKEISYREEDATGNNDNNFNFNEVAETYKTKGFGVNLKLGVIVKPIDYLRLGLAIHTPTWYNLEDSYNGSMLTDLDNYRTTPGAIATTLNDVLLDGEVPEYKYELISPWRFMLSGSYVLREVADVTKQKGFLTADIEYVTYKSNRFRNAEEYDDGGYYDQVNEGVKNYYKGAFNFRVGGELKFTTIMGRLGFSYYSDPYKDSELKGSKMFISGGLGYRKSGMFIDLTYVYGIQKDVSFPYRLPDKANTFATVNGKGGNIMLTVGFKI